MSLTAKLHGLKSLKICSISYGKLWNSYYFCWIFSASHGIFHDSYQFIRLREVIVGIASNLIQPHFIFHHLNLLWYAFLNQPSVRSLIYISYFRFMAKILYFLLPFSFIVFLSLRSWKSWLTWDIAFGTASYLNKTLNVIEYTPNTTTSCKLGGTSSRSNSSSYPDRTSFDIISLILYNTPFMISTYWFSICLTKILNVSRTRAFTKSSRLISFAKHRYNQPLFSIF